MIVALLAAASTLTGADSLSLAAALARARAERPRLRELRAAVAEARANLRIAGTVPNPTVTYSHSGSYPSDHLLVDQPLDWLVRRGPEREAAKFGILRAEADSVQYGAELGRDVRVAFYAALAARVTYGLTTAQAGIADSLSVLAARRLQAGDISLLEREQIGQEALRANALVSRAREAARASAAALVRAIAWTERAAPDLAGDLGAGLDTPPDTSVAAMTDLPVMRQARADSAAAAALVRATERARLPIPSIQAGADFSDPTISPPNHAQSVLGLAIPLPVWNVGGGQVAAARARAEAQAARTAETRLELQRVLTEQRVLLVEAAIRASFARDSLIPTARRVRERVVRGFAAGDTDVLPVLDALRAEREANLAFVQELFSYQEAVAGWYALTGQDP